MSDEKKSHTEHLAPYIPAQKDGVAEFTIQAVVLGLILSVVFNAANAYLGLKIGMTVSASIPSAIISMATLRMILPKLLGRTGTILENNIVHAFASTGESLAAAIIFTVPALMFLGGDMSNHNVFLLGMVGGLLGLLMMIPLRQSLMVHEHKNLPFPEGSACAKVLMAGDKGGTGAKPVFIGILFGGLFKFAMSGLNLFKDTLMWTFPKLHQAGFGYEISPLFVGVGYLIGLRIAAVIFAGGMFGYWVIIPLIHSFGGANIVAPGTIPIDQMSTADMRSTYLRYIGAGGVAFGGLISLIRSLPDIFGSLSHSVKLLRSATKATEKLEAATHEAVRDPEHKYIVFGGALLGFLTGGFAYDPAGFSMPAALAIRFGCAILACFIFGGIFHIVAEKSAALRQRFLRTEQDIPLSIVGAGVFAMFLFLWLYPGFELSFLEAAIVIVISMFFVAVSARMVGLIGTTNQPVSGMTIAALLTLTLMFVAAKHAPGTVQIAAITGGAIVCIAISLSGDLSQDLKSAALIGATPWKVQLAQIMGTLGSAVRSGFILLILYKAYGFGMATPEHPNPLEAPQAQLMAKLVQGVTGGSLPWALLGLGAGIGLVCELCGISALAFSIGLYLPITNWPMILLGGLIAYVVSRQRKSAMGEEDDQGSLFSSGLIAGDALMGIGIAGIIAFSDWRKSHLAEYLHLRDLPGGTTIPEALLSSLLYACIAGTLYWYAMRSGKKQEKA